jgi:hypothetical protein
MCKTIGAQHFDLPIAFEIPSRPPRQHVVCLHCDDAAVFAYHLGDDR